MALSLATAAVWWSSGCGDDTSGPGVLAGASGGTGGGSAPGAGGAGSGPISVDQTVTVTPDQRHQTLVGFGGAVAFYTNFLSARTDDIYTVLFNDLGLDILRVGNWYQNQPSTGTSTTTAFSDSAIVTVVQRARAALGYTPKLLMSSWSPPSYLKSNGATKGTRGTLIQSGGVYQYAQFADWWVRSLAAYAAQGVVPDYISIQNEPDFFNAGWETCQFDAAEGATNAGYGRALDAVATAIQGSSLERKPQLVGPETAGLGNNVVSRYLANTPAAQLSVLAHHLYNGGGAGSDPAPDSFTTPMTNVANVDTDMAAGRPIFMTEYAPATPSMFNTAWLIHNALTVEGVAAYIYWDLIWAPPAAGAAPTGLVTIASANGSSPYTINDTYYAVKHFARWTDPGWTRVGTTASASVLRASAFVSPDGSSLTVVLLNTDTAAHGVTLDLGGFAFGTSTVYRTSGTSERAAAMPFSDGSVALPARSIATVVLTP